MPLFFWYILQTLCVLRNKLDIDMILIWSIWPSCSYGVHFIIRKTEHQNNYFLINILFWWGRLTFYNVLFPLAIPPFMSIKSTNSNVAQSKSVSRSHPDTCQLGVPTTQSCPRGTWLIPNNIAGSPLVEHRQYVMPARIVLGHIILYWAPTAQTCTV